MGYILDGTLEEERRCIAEMIAEVEAMGINLDEEDDDEGEM